MNKAKRVIENLAAEKASEICSQIGVIDEKANAKNQAKYINQILNTAENLNICMADTMRKCGGCCLSASVIKTAKKLYKKSNNIEEFLNALNDAGLGGGNLHISGEKIIGIYKSCYCNIPKQIENMNKSYCECSAGWYKRLFSEVFERSVMVKIVDTILNGAAECTFEISDFE